jgi:hypothetical protein
MDVFQKERKPAITSKGFWSIELWRKETVQREKSPRRRRWIGDDGRSPHRPETWLVPKEDRSSHHLNIESRANFFPYPFQRITVYFRYGKARSARRGERLKSEPITNLHQEDSQHDQGEYVRTRFFAEPGGRFRIACSDQAMAIFSWAKASFTATERSLRS